MKVEEVHHTYLLRTVQYKKILFAYVHSNSQILSIYIDILIKSTIPKG